MEKLNSFVRMHQKTIFVAVFVCLALLSFSVSKLNLLDSWEKGMVAALDVKRNNVALLAGATSGTALALDATSLDSMASAVTDLTGYLVFVFGAIWLQKYLLGVTIAVSFQFLIPVACLLFAGNLFWKKENIHKLASKVLVLGFVLFATIPTSIMVSQHIESTYQDSITETVQKADEQNKKITEEASKDKGLLGQVVDKVTSFFKNTTEGVKEFIGDSLDAIAVLIVTTCILPILVFVFFFWLIKLLFGLDIQLKLPKAASFKKNFAHKNRSLN